MSGAKRIKNPGMFDAFSRWVNTEPALRSAGDCLAITDIDKVFHRYIEHQNSMTSRGVQHMMMLEYKTRGGKLSTAQADTLFMFHQVMLTTGFQWQERGAARLRGQFSVKHDANRRDVYVRSSMTGGKILLRCYGVFFLRMSGETPADSEWMEWSVASSRLPWDSRRITTSDLIKLLRFEVHPASFRAGNLSRSHHRPAHTTPCVLFEKNDKKK